MPSLQSKFFLGLPFPHRWHSPTSAPAPHEIIPNQHSGCWETKMYCKVSTHGPTASIIQEQLSGCSLCRAFVQTQRRPWSPPSLCACATELKGAKDHTRLQLDGKKDFLTRFNRSPRKVQGTLFFGKVHGPAQPGCNPGTSEAPSLPLVSAGLKNKSGRHRTK